METSMISTTGISSSIISNVFSESNENTFLTVKQGEAEVSFVITPTHIKNITKSFDDHKNIQKKTEDFYRIGMTNLLKKNRYLELSLELAEDLITEDEFEEEIERSPDKYIIQLKDLNDYNDLQIIESITKKINEKFSVDQISELFSISHKSINKVLSL